MEGKRHLGPVSWPVHHLRAELRTRLGARVAARARGGRRSRGCSRMAAAGGLVGGACAGAPSKPGSDGGRTDEQEELPPLDRHPVTLPRMRTASHPHSFTLESLSLRPVACVAPAASVLTGATRARSAETPRIAANQPAGAYGRKGVPEGQVAGVDRHDGGLGRSAVA